MKKFDEITKGWTIRDRLMSLGTVCHESEYLEQPVYILNTWDNRYVSIVFSPEGCSESEPFHTEQAAIEDACEYIRGWLAREALMNLGEEWKDAGLIDQKEWSSLIATCGES